MFITLEATITWLYSNTFGEEDDDENFEKKKKKDKFLAA